MRVRAVAKYVGGRKVEDALALLGFYKSPSARAMAKVVESAAANAENNNQMPVSELKVVDVFVDKGATLKRFRPQARGRVSPLLKRSSHITVVVDTEE